MSLYSKLQVYATGCMCFICSENQGTLFYTFAAETEGCCYCRASSPKQGQSAAGLSPRETTDVGKSRYFLDNLVSELYHLW